jgi:hypothetical protein
MTVYGPVCGAPCCRRRDAGSTMGSRPDERKEHRASLQRIRERLQEHRASLQRITEPLQGASSLAAEDQGTSAGASSLAAEDPGTSARSIEPGCRGSMNVCRSIEPGCRGSGNVCSEHRAWLQRIRERLQRASSLVAEARARCRARRIRGTSTRSGWPGKSPGITRACTLGRGAHGRADELASAAGRRGAEWSVGAGMAAHAAPGEKPQPGAHVA